MKEFKAQTVRLVRESGQSVGVVTRELDLTETGLRSWVGQAELGERGGRTGRKRGARLMRAGRMGSFTQVLTKPG